MKFHWKLISDRRYIRAIYSKGFTKRTFCPGNSSGPCGTLRSSSQIRLHAPCSHEYRGLDASSDMGFRARMDLLCALGAARARNIRVSAKSARISRIPDETIARSYRCAFAHVICVRYDIMSQSLQPHLNKRTE